MFTIFCLPSCLTMYPLGGCVATVVSIFFKLATVGRSSIVFPRISLLFRASPSLLLRFPYAFSRFYVSSCLGFIGCTASSHPVVCYRSLCSFYALFSDFALPSLTLWTKLLYIHSRLRLSAYISVTFTILTDHFSLGYVIIPQWALAHQVRALIFCYFVFRGIQRSCIGIFTIFHSSYFHFFVPFYRCS